jgi:hypothetical protein
VVQLDDPVRDRELAFHRLGLCGSSKAGETVRVPAAAQFRVVGEEIVGYRHDLAELVVWSVVEGDPVAQRLAHLLGSIGSAKERNRQHQLRVLGRIFLEGPAHQVVVGLVGAAEFYVGLDRDRVHALQHRVHELHQGDGQILAVAAPEVVAFEQPGDGKAAADPQNIGEVSVPQPGGVVVEFETVLPQDLQRLAQVSPCVSACLLLCQDPAGLGATRRVADLSGEVAHDQDGYMAVVLELAEFPQDDSVSEGQVRAGRVNAQLDAQRPAFGAC